jgi:large conductance mechanosensitive channel
MSLLKEFREFAIRGSVVDLAVGVVIGAAFGKIVSSFVANIIMPPLNLLTAKYGVNFNELALKVETEAPKMLPDGKMEMDAAGAPIMAMQQYPILNYGPFIQTVVDFLLVAAAIFLAIKVLNKVKARYEEKKAEEEIAEKASEEVELLREIRDSLKRT